MSLVNLPAGPLKRISNRVELIDAKGKVTAKYAVTLGGGITSGSDFTFRRVEPGVIESTAALQFTEATPE